MRERRRTVIAVLAFPAVVAVSVAIEELRGLHDIDWAQVAIFVVPVVLYGAVVARTWALAMPLLWGAVFLGVLRVGDLITGDCSVCGSDEDWGNYPLIFAAVAVLPMTVAVALGVVAGRLRARRSASASAGSA